MPPRSERYNGAPRSPPKSSVARKLAGGDTVALKQTSVKGRDRVRRWIQEARTSQQIQPQGRDSIGRQWPSLEQLHSLVGFPPVATLSPTVDADAPAFVLSPPSPPPSLTDGESCDEGDNATPRLPGQSRQIEHHAAKRVSDGGVRKPMSTGRTTSRPSQGRRNSRRSLPTGDEDSDTDEDQADRSPSTVVGYAGSGSTTSLFFACPYYKHNSMQHMQCWRLRMNRVRDVKQHLNRKHRMPMHCPVCGSIFQDSSSRDHHIRARDCSRYQFNYEGINETQAASLGRRVARSLDPSDQWFTIWDILFPGEPRPQSPYVADGAEEAFSMVQEFWKHNGTSFVADFINNNDLGPGSRGQILSSASNEQLAGPLSQIIDSLLDRFRASSSAVVGIQENAPALDNLASRPVRVARTNSRTASTNSSPEARTIVLQGYSNISPPRDSPLGELPDSLASGRSADVTPIQSLSPYDFSSYSTDGSSVSPLCAMDGSPQFLQLSAQPRITSSGFIDPSLIHPDMLTGNTSIPMSIGQTREFLPLNYGSLFAENSPPPAHSLDRQSSQVDWPSFDPDPTL